MATQDNQLGHAHHQITNLLNRFSAEEQCRLIQSIITLQGLNIGHTRGAPVSSVYKKSIGDSQNLIGSSREPVFSGHEELSPKEFITQKKPRTDVERVACLAYYLTHYHDSKYFKTTDISKLNTEAAQPKLSNAANSVNNANTMGYLAPAPKKHHKQISAAGEQYVSALPDRDLAKKAMEKPRPRRAKKKKSIKRNA